MVALYKVERFCETHDGVYKLTNIYDDEFVRTITETYIDSMGRVVDTTDKFSLKKVIGASTDMLKKIKIK